MCRSSWAADQLLKVSSTQFVGAGAWHVDFLNRKRLAEFVHHRAFIVLSIDDLLWNGSNSASGNCGPAFQSRSKGHARCAFSQPMRLVKAACGVGKRQPLQRKVIWGRLNLSTKVGANRPLAPPRLANTSSWPPRRILAQR